MSGTSEELASMKTTPERAGRRGEQGTDRNAGGVRSVRRLTRQRSQEIERKLHASATETRDIYHSQLGTPFDLTKLYDLPRPFEFHGYLRSGYGMNGEGGKMEAFKAPGAFAKYRLGNEAETYGEMA